MTPPGVQNGAMTSESTDAEPTEVLPPVDPAPAEAATEVVPVEGVPGEPPAGAAPAPRRRRRGWIIAAVVVGALVVLGVIAFLVAEAMAKDYARGYVRAQIVEVLQLPEDADVDIDLGGGSIILQALAGRVDSVDVDVAEATFGDLTGGVQLSAQGVPLDAQAPVDALRVRFALSAEQLAEINGGGAADPDAATFAFVDGEATLETEFELFGLKIPLEFSMVPSAVDGDLVLSPTRLVLGEATFTPGQADDSFLGRLAAAFLEPQRFCLADRVPAALVLDDAVIADEAMRLTFRGDGVALGSDTLQTPGECPAE